MRNITKNTANKTPLRYGNTIGAKLYSFYNLNPVYHCMAKTSRKMRAASLFFHLIKLLAFRQIGLKRSKNICHTLRGLLGRVKP